MRFNHTISAILRSVWMIEKRWAESQLPLVLSLLNGQKVSFVDRTGDEEMELPFAVDPKTMQRHELYVGTFYGLKPNPNIPEGSVAILPVTGPITKYNGVCGEPGNIQRAAWLADMERRQNVVAVVQLLDTPGGDTRAINSFVSSATRMKKPLLSYVDGMAASLGIWHTSYSDEVYLSNKMDEMGSVGSYAMLYDYRGYFEKEGLKLHEIYAPQSTDKNKPYRDALSGDYSAIEEELRAHVDTFISSVKSQRPKAAETVKEWGTGKMFTAEDAVKIGLADGIRSFDQVVSKAAWNAKMKRKKSL